MHGSGTTPDQASRSPVSKSSPKIPSASGWARMPLPSPSSRFDQTARPAPDGRVATLAPSRSTSPPISISRLTGTPASLTL